MQAQDDPELERLKEKIKQQQDRIVELLNYILQLERELQTGEIQMSTYSMTPINSGTRLRAEHGTFTRVIASYNRGQLVVGDEIWEAPADGVEVRKGDKWLGVATVDGVAVPERGWMALIHKGVVICDNFKVITSPTPTPAPLFPQSFILTDPSGAKAEYTFVRVL